MSLISLQEAVMQFGEGNNIIDELGQGLIHQTFKVSFSDNHTIILQRLNAAIFKQPSAIIDNYLLITTCLQQQGNHNIPTLLATKDGKYYWIDDKNNYWRATTYIDNSYSPVSVQTENEAYVAAKCFAQFTRNLVTLDVSKLQDTIPGFHNLDLRFRQFEDAIAKAHISRLLKSTHVISEMRDRICLVDFYKTVVTSPGYPTRAMHHDAKIGNILFDLYSKEPICPVDLDTVMPGKYFSDLGDMIRTMACTQDENSTAWELIDVNPAYYNAVMNGYKEGMGDALTATEKQHIHRAGILMTCMQCLRYVTDFLDGDVYYKTSYPEQNLNRALNQLILLEKLEEMKK